jgi:hypothetical protein
VELILIDPARNGKNPKGRKSDALTILKQTSKLPEEEHNSLLPELLLSEFFSCFPGLRGIETELYLKGTNKLRRQKINKNKQAYSTEHFYQRS